MRKLLIILALLVVPFLAHGYIDAYAEGGYPGTKAVEPEVEKGTSCPAYPTMKDEYTCFECHVKGKGFVIKEKDPHDVYNYPNYDTKIVGPGIGYYLVDGIHDDPFVAAMTYLIEQHNIKHVILEVNNPGGGLFSVWRMIGYMAAWEKTHGVVFETRCNGFAMSAGFLLTVAGTPGHRYANAGATLMWHELLTFAFLQVKTPSSTEDESRIMRGLQDTVNTWLSERSKIAKENIDKKVHRQEWWMNGLEAKEMGFVDHVIGE